MPTVTAAELEPAVLAWAESQGMAARDAEQQLVRVRGALDAVEEQLVRIRAALNSGQEAMDGTDREALQLAYGGALAQLALLARHLGTSLVGARDGLLKPDMPGLMPFLQNQPMIWENRALWLSCLGGAMSYHGAATVKHLGAVIACVEDSGRIRTSLTLERLMAVVLEG